jgi:hypothetical protein
MFFKGKKFFPFACYRMLAPPFLSLFFLAIPGHPFPSLSSLSSAPTISLCGSLVPYGWPGMAKKKREKEKGERGAVSNR